MRRPPRSRRESLEENPPYSFEPLAFPRVSRVQVGSPRRLMMVPTFPAPTLPFLLSAFSLEMQHELSRDNDFFNRRRHVSPSQ